MQPLAEIRELASAESVDAFTLAYTNLLQNHPDCPVRVQNILVLTILLKKHIFWIYTLLGNIEVRATVLYSRVLSVAYCSHLLCHIVPLNIVGIWFIAWNLDHVVTARHMFVMLYGALTGKTHYLHNSENYCKYNWSKFKLVGNGM